MSTADNWVSRRFGVELVTAAGSRELGELVQLALRRNAGRAHLLVSTVLGKHIPVDPRVVQAAGTELGAGVSARLAAPALVLGYAETATALGHLVAEELGAGYLHSTRRAVPGVPPAAGFEEPHSHATRHALLPDDPHLLAAPGPVVLVDDELSTGRTALNTIAALQVLQPRPRYVIAALVDLRGRDDRAATDAAAAAAGTRIDVVALATGEVRLPAGFAAAAAEPLVHAGRPVDEARRPSAVERVELPWPVDVRDGGRHGFTPADVGAARAAARRSAAALAPRLTGRVLVLGFEELMYAPLLVALELVELGCDVRFSATTRSPILAVDEPGYPIRTALRFPAPDEPADRAGDRFAYNVAPAAGARWFDHIVLIVDGPADTPTLSGEGGLLAQLATVTGRVHLAQLPSYRPAGVEAR